jgi:signal transduction histidine kinase
LVAGAVPVLLLAASSSVGTSLGYVPAFLPATLAVAWICDLLTVFLLVTRFLSGDSWRLLTLACAYLWSAAVLSIYGLVFPGLVTPTGLLGATPSSPPWLWTAWHVGFPVLIGIALMPCPTRRAPRAVYSARFRRVAAGGCGLTVIVVVAAVVWLVTAYARHLPVIITAGDYAVLSERFGPLIISVNVFAVAVSAVGLFVRASRGLEAWAFVAVCASCGDAVLTLTARSRYTVGWYGARTLSLVAALVVLANLLRQINLLYQRARRLADELSRRNEELQAVHIEQLHRQNVELERVGQVKNNFLAKVSHELRTPLNAVIGFTGTVLMGLPGPLNAEQDRQLRLVQISARHLLSIINDLLDLATIESGRVPLTLEAVDCRDVVDEVVQSLQTLATGKGLTLDLDAGGDLPEIVTVDRRALGQILINLVNNAIKFTDTGGVRVCLVPAAEGEGSLRIEIRDTGPGIPAEDLTRIFRAFERSLNATVADHEGTGLGLHISQKLAELLDATIAVSSVLGVGSTFTVSLPDHADPPEHPMVSSGAEAASASR